ncbi:hypothetical protein [Flavobacterium lacisediminis]|uniref:Uncharacterized protein n=1 Tax=Flavobacterium lacisediminis TaxID=2989705 RepID=A0ABT3ELI7_9FLAO|nr:hypothetical protein [Flavobacterium lacisediminis]MCW1148994.1 hypothetical protein [Flavobacterium lacisediminis]
MKRKFEISKETILPIIVFVLSVLNILSNINNFSLSILLSIIGIISTILFFRKNSFSTKLIYIWLIAQVIIIEPIFNLSQSSFTLAFTLGLGSYSLKINFLPLLFLGLLKVVESSNLIGKEINLLDFRKNVISDFLPIKGKISERIDFNENKNWLLIELEKNMEYEGAKINKVLIKNKDTEKSIKLKEKNQIAHLRLVTDESKLITKEISEFPFVDWIRCE